MTTSQRTAAILVAAGRGLRAGAGGPKQYRTIGGGTRTYRSPAALSAHPPVAGVAAGGDPDGLAPLNDGV